MLELAMAYDWSRSFLLLYSSKFLLISLIYYLKHLIIFSISAILVLKYMFSPSTFFAVSFAVSSSISFSDFSLVSLKYSLNPPESPPYPYIPPPLVNYLIIQHQLFLQVLPPPFLSKIYMKSPSNFFIPSP